MNRFSLLLVAVGLILGACCDEDFLMPSDYDFFEGAYDITSLMENCSEGEAFTTVGATADGVAGSCWGGGPVNNVWLKFVAPASGEAWVTIYVDGTYGTQRNSRASIWSDKSTELACEAVSYPEEYLYFYATVTPGQVYFISVDTSDSQSAGTFALCISGSD